MADTGGDIIIKGGSCEIHFEDGLYTKDGDDPKRRIHKHVSYKIRRIEISGDDVFKGDFPDGFEGEINIWCKPEALPEQK